MVVVNDDGSSVVGVRGLQCPAPNIAGLRVLELRRSEEASKQAIVIAM